MKKFIKATFIVMLSLAFTVALAACSPRTVSIAIDEANMPQTIFVRGNDLDLSAGKLTVDRGSKGTEQISLTDPDVTVEGYDKTKLGSQTLTISYDGKSVSLEVTTVPRISAAGATTEYFVGESFISDGGRFVITRDDGTSFDVDAASVTVSGFDSSAAGTVAVNASYTGEEGTFTDAFDVTVYAIAQMTFKRPDKTEYFSHEQLSLDGGRITLYNEDQSFSRSVPITADMVEGFDPDAAGEDNMDVAHSVRQTLTVKYGDDFSRTYGITILYSKVSLFRKIAAELSVLDFSTYENPVSITEAQGERALTAIEAYHTLGDEDRLLITDEEKKTVARPATVYGFKKWTEAIRACGNTFDVRADALVFAEGSTHGGAKDELAALRSDAAADVMRLGDILSGMLDDFSLSAYTIYDDYPYDIVFVKLYYVPSSEDWEGTYIPMLENMIAIYDIFSIVPEDWSTHPISTYENQVKAFYGKVNTMIADQVSYSRAAYRVVSKWRANDDLFDIFFTYYYDAYTHAATDNEKAAALLAMDVVANYYALPTKLETVYTNLETAYSQYYDLTKGNPDTTLFMSYIRDSRASIAALEGDALCSGLYELLGFLDFVEDKAISLPDLLMSMERASVYGCIDINYGMQDVEEYDVFWQTYLTVVDGLYEFDEIDDAFDDEAFCASVDNLFANFLALTPTQQLGFLSSVNLYYSNSEQVINEFEEQEGGTYWTHFSMLIMTRYKKLLSADAYNVFCEYLSSYEGYLRRDLVGTDMRRVIGDIAITDYDSRSLDSGEAAKLAPIKNACAKLTELFDANGNYKEPTLNDAATALLNELKDAAFAANRTRLVLTLGLELLMAGAQEGSLETIGQAIPLLVYETLAATTARTENAVAAIKASGNEALKTMIEYGSVELEVMLDESDGHFTAASVNPEYFVYITRGFGISVSSVFEVIVGKDFDSNYFYDAVKEDPALLEFLVKAEPILSYYIEYAWVGSEDAEFPELSDATVQGIEDAYAALTNEEKMTVMMYFPIGDESDYMFTSANVYHLGLAIWYTNKLGWDIAGATTNVVSKLIVDLERGVEFYELLGGKTQTAMPYDALTEAVADFDAAYAALSPEEKGEFDALFADRVTAVKAKITALNPLG